MLQGAFIALATTAQVAVAPPPAEPGHHMIEAGAWLGLFIPSRDHELYDSLATDHRAYDPVNASLGLRLSYFPLPFVGVEGEGGYMPSGTRGGDLGHLFTARGQGVLQWPMRLTPFAVVGGGLLASTGGPGSDVDEAFHWGLGAKYYISDRLSVRLDGRHIISGARGPGAGNTSHFEVLAGVSFTLFRAEPKRDEWTDADVGTPALAEAPVAAPASAPSGEDASRTMEMVATSTPAVVVRRALDSVHFAFGSAELRPNTYSALDLAADVLRRNPRMRIRIIGHTDHIGTARYNQGLSERRAAAVRDYLISAGIAPERLQAFGRGETAPIAPNETREGRARNRRSEFDIDPGEERDADASTSDGDEGDPPPR